MSFKTILCLQATFSSLELDIDVKTFATRFFIQKYAYFLQEFGADLGYAFGMYLHGPYSPELAKDAYTLQELEFTREEIESVSVNSQAVRRMKAFVDDMNKFISPSKGIKYWLELFASLHFLFKYGYPTITSLDDAKNRTKLTRFRDDITTASAILGKAELAQITVARGVP